MTERIFVSPAKYVQGKNVIGKISKYIEGMGTNALVMADKVADAIFSADQYAKSYKESK